MANKKGKHIDNTYLSIDYVETTGMMHRDYIAHCLRWSHIVKFCQKTKAKARILDIGCGIELNLPKLLRSSHVLFDYYAGVDHGKVDVKKYFNKSGRGWEPNKIWSQTDFIDIPDTELDNINLMVCFEVLEHVEPTHAAKMLAKMKKNLSPDGNLFVSTPCYDPNLGAADNHVNEMTYEAMGSMLETLGFAIENHYGTFASQRDYKDYLTDDQKSVFEGLSKYYESNFLSTIFAPLHPSRSRNCIWHCRHQTPLYLNNFPRIDTLKTPLGSSKDWQDLLKIDMYKL